jgi:hypothetical protein
MAAQKARQGVAAVRSRGMTTTPFRILNNKTKNLTKKQNTAFLSYHVERRFGKPGKRMGCAATIV